MNNRQKKIERNTLIFAGVTGFSAAGGWLALFSTHVPFSVFPFLCVIMGLVILYNRYINHPMEPGMGAQLLISVVLGVLVYTAFYRVMHPGTGSNFVPLMLSLASIFWLSYKRGVFAPKAEEIDAEEA